MTFQHQADTEIAEAEFDAAHAAAPPPQHPDDVAPTQADVEAIAAGYASLLEPNSKLARAADEREDVRNLLGSINALLAYDAALRPAAEAMLPPSEWKQRAAHVVRWELLHHASHDPEVNKDCLRVLVFIMRCVNRHGLVAWPNATTLCKGLGLRKDAVSRYLSTLEDRGYIVRTKSHKRAVVWFRDDDNTGYALGGRGAAYTFGTAKFPTYEAMVEASDALMAKMLAHAATDVYVALGSNFNVDDYEPETVPSHDEVASGSNFKSVHVAPESNFISREVASARKTREPYRASNPDELLNPGERLRADAQPTADDHLASDQAEQDQQAGGTALTVVPSNDLLLHASGGGLLDAPMMVGDVELPIAVADAVACARHSSKTAKRKAMTLGQTIREVRGQGIEPAEIVAALNLAVAKLDDNASDGDLLGKCTSFVANLPKFRARDIAKAQSDAQQATDRDLEQIFRAHSHGRVGGMTGTNVTGSMVKCACMDPAPIEGLTAADVNRALAGFVTDFAAEAPYGNALDALRRRIVTGVLVRRYGSARQQVDGPVRHTGSWWAVPQSLADELMASYQFTPEEARLARGEVEAWEITPDRSADPKAYLAKCAGTMLGAAFALVEDEVSRVSTEWLAAHYGRDLQGISTKQLREYWRAMVAYAHEANSSAASISERGMSLRPQLKQASQAAAIPTQPRQRPKGFN